MFYTRFTKRGNQLVFYFFNIVWKERLYSYENVVALLCQIIYCFNSFNWWWDTRFYFFCISFMDNWKRNLNYQIFISWYPIKIFIQRKKSCIFCAYYNWIINLVKCIKNLERSIGYIRRCTELYSIFYDRYHSALSSRSFIFYGGW